MSYPMCAVHSDEFSVAGFKVNGETVEACESCAAILADAYENDNECNCELGKGEDCPEHC